MLINELMPRKKSHECKDNPLGRTMKSFLSRIRITRLLVGAILAGAIPPGAAISDEKSRDDPSTTLWYAEPAASWQREALPIGNGRLGAMIFGGVGHERIALNEESVWSGSRTENNRDDAANNLPEIRRLLLAGKNAEAEALVNQPFTCQGAGSGRGGGARVPFGCYQALGDLNIVWKSNAEPAWQDGKVTDFSIRSKQSGKATVRVNGETKTVTVGEL